MQRVDRRTRGLIVVSAMVLFIGAASIVQRMEEVSDTADAAQSSAEEASSNLEEVSGRVDDLEARLGPGGPY